MAALDGRGTLPGRHAAPVDRTRHSHGDALHAFSDDMRDRRLLRAEERANKPHVKMVGPLGLFIFRVILGIAMLPVIIRPITVTSHIVGDRRILGGSPRVRVTPLTPRRPLTFAMLAGKFLP
jgi:hypothetical protein